MPLASVPASAPDDVVTALLEDGAVIVDELLPPDLLARFNAEIDPLLDDAPVGGAGFVNEVAPWFFGSLTRNVTGIAGKSRVFATEILPHPLYAAVCDAVLLPSCARYILNIAHVLDRGPGSTPQLLHRDELVWNHLPEPHPEVQLASVIALVDFTAENGATRVAPGSHRWPKEQAATDDDLVAAEMPAGSAVVYLGSTIHGGGANVTDAVTRRGMHVSYCLGWLRTEENQYLTTTIDDVRSWPRASQELVGYAAHDALMQGGGYLGVVELQDPVELLAHPPRVVGRGAPDWLQPG
jgi:hypothetical protein